MSSFDTSRPIVELACELLHRWTGFELGGAAPWRLREFLDSRARQLGHPDTFGYLLSLRDASPRDAEPQRLINLVTNGLTAFWRDEPQLQALTAVMDQIVQERPDRPLQIWCAGCSTGEEAYTVAMIAREQSLDARVLGTDINTEALALARQGLYDTWSLRRLAASRQRRFFRPVDDRRWQINAEVAALVRFRHHNLLQSPPRPDGAARWDVILCRNVLIYLDAEARSTALGHFADALDPGGYLLLGSSEQIHDRQIQSHLGFYPVRQSEGFVYQLTEGPGFTVAAASPADALLPPTLEIVTSLSEDTSELVENDAVAELLRAGLRHLNRQQSDAAVACFEAAVSYDPFHPESYCLLGRTLKQTGALHPALDAFRKALFLQPHNWYAAFEAGHLLELTDDDGRALQAYRQAREGLDAPRDVVRHARYLSRALEPVDGARSRITQTVDTILGPTA